MCEVDLSQLKPGEKGRIKEINQYSAVRRRLRDMGFVPGADLICVFAAPSGSPIAFYVKGAIVALRREDSIQIMVNRSV